MPTPAEHAEWFIHEGQMLAREFMHSMDQDRNHAIVLGKIQGHVHAAHVVCGTDVRDQVTAAISEITGPEHWWGAPEEG